MCMQIKRPVIRRWEKCYITASRRIAYRIHCRRREIPIFMEIMQKVTVATHIWLVGCLAVWLAGFPCGWNFHIARQPGIFEETEWQLEWCKWNALNGTYGYDEQLCKTEKFRWPQIQQWYGRDCDSMILQMFWYGKFYFILVWRRVYRIWISGCLRGLFQNSLTTAYGYWAFCGTGEMDMNRRFYLF